MKVARRLPYWPHPGGARAGWAPDKSFYISKLNARRFSRRIGERKHCSTQIPRLQVPLEHLRIERAPRCASQQVAAGEAGAVAVHVLPQPGEKRREVAPADGLRDLRLGAAGGVEELGGGHGAQRIGREVAPGAVVPVDVLQAALAVRG